MAATKRDPRYLSQGSAAYDVRTAERKRRAREVALPEERPAHRQQRRVRAKVAVSPFSLIGIAVVACMAVLVIFGYVRLYEADSEVARLESSLSALQEERRKLDSYYEEMIDLEAIEQQATALGMRQPRSDQMVYLNLSAADHAEITPAASKNLLVRIYCALRDSVLGIVEYLS